MPEDNKSQKDNVGGFPSNNKPQSPDNEAGKQNPGLEINRKTERDTSPEQA